jgi:hypothetical protein
VAVPIIKLIIFQKEGDSTMNRKRKIVVVSVFGLVALMLTTGWGVLSGADWPPPSYQEYSPAGSWIVALPNRPVLTISPRDPAGLSSAIVTVTLPAQGDPFPEATSSTPGFFTVIKTGPNADHMKGIHYLMKDGTPSPTTVGILVVELQTTLIAPDEMEIQDGTFSFYSGAADKDGDGLPDAGEKPVSVMLLPTVHAKRI